MFCKFDDDKLDVDRFVGCDCWTIWNQLVIGTGEPWLAHGKITWSPLLTTINGLRSEILGGTFECGSFLDEEFVFEKKEKKKY